MYTISHSSVVSKNDITIKNFVYKNDNPAETLVVVFPGMGYTCFMPVLFYCTQAALQAGCDVLNLQYYYQCVETGFSHSDDE